MPHSIRTPNDEQAKVLDDLNSRIENFEWEWDGVGHRDTQWIVFTGDGQDGPCVGYIDSEGAINWMVEA